VQGDEPSEAAAGRLPARYELRGRIGAGATGTVDRAWDRELLIEVALKRLSSRGAAEHLYRLKREFRALRDLSHPNLVRLYDLDVSHGECFFTMELIEGTDFLSFVRADATPQGIQDYAGLRAATVQLVRGLRALHEAGKVHRDIKPSNVLLARNGRLVLIDFGFVRDMTPLVPTASHEFVGTFAYMAPEAAMGEPGSPASDWYSVGVMLFEALTGQLPFVGSPMEIMLHKQRGLATMPAGTVATIPPALEAAVRRLLEPDPTARAGAEVLLGALDLECEIVISYEPARHSQPLFVDRMSELASLDAMLAAVKEGSPAVVHVRGPSGIGKSELVRRFLERTGEDSIVLAGGCHLRESVPHQALDAIVDELSRRLVSESDQTVDAVAPRFAGALLRLFPVLGRVPALAHKPTVGLAVEPQELRRQGIQALRELLARLSDRKPVTLWIDDAQWSDGDSALLIRELLRPVDAPRMLVVLSYRSGDASGAPIVEATAAEDRVAHHRIDLAPLEPPQTRALAVALLQEAVNSNDLDAMIDSVVEESAGSPFFAGELARLARQRGSLGGASVPITPRVADVVNARLDALGPASRTILELVAVAGRPIGSDLALELAGLGAGGRREVRELSAQCLLRTHAGGEGERLEVYHDRIREVLLGDLGPERRRDCHRRLAEGFAALERPDPHVLVEHYLGAGEEALAAEHAMRAGEQAAEALAFDRAAELFGLSFRLRGARDDDWTLLEKRASALANAGRGSDAGETYEAAAAAVGRVAPDRGTELTLRCLAGDQYLASGRLRRGVETLWGVLSDLAVPLPASAAAARRTALWLRLKLLTRGLTSSLRDPVTVPPETLHRLDALWAAAKGTLMLDAVLSSLMSARHLAEALRAGHPAHLQLSLCVESGFAASLGGRFLTRRSRQALAHATALASRMDEPYQWGWVHGTKASVAYWCEHWEDTIEGAERAIDLFTTRCTGAAWEATTLRTFLLAALSHLGRVRELTTRLPLILDDARRRGDLFALSLVRTGHSVLAPLAADDPDRALREAEGILEPFRADHFTSQHFHHLIATVQAHLYAGEPWKAWQRIEGAWPELRKVGYLFLACLACQLRYLRALAALAAADAPPPDALRAWTPRRLERVAQREARLLARATVPSGAPRAAAIQATLAARRGHRAGQRSSLVAAVEGFDRVQMALHREGARLQLAALDGSAPSRAEAEARFRDEEVRNPLALLRTLMPGSPPVPPV
jgi:eukaryotic-like serine/threonine-protein kinase